MQLNDDQILELLSSPRRASRNNIVSDCPFCGKQSHFFVKMKTEDVDKYGVNKSFNFDCKKCGEHGRVYKLLAQLGQLHLLEGELIDINKELETNLIDVFQKEAEVEINLDVKTINLPIGFERTYDHPYLRSRGWTELEFSKYVVGTTEIITKLENYVIIGLERDNEMKSYIARTTLNKSQINKIEANYKTQGLKKTYPRYRNAKSEFSRLLGGYDEINFLTETVILVEGLFDKTKTDQVLGLDYQQEWKCCFTFGKKVSLEQIILLLRKGVRNVILVYDPDAMDDMKKIGFVLNKHFDSVLIGDPGEKDLGDSNEDDFNRIFNNLKTSWDFSLNKLQIIQL